MRVRKTVTIGFVCAGLLLGLPMAALADDGTTRPKPDDTGIQALHQATAEFRLEVSALRDECRYVARGAGEKPGSTAARERREHCRRAFAELREGFKAARRDAIAKHHTFMEQWRAEHARSEEGRKDSTSP